MSSGTNGQRKPKPKPRRKAGDGGASQDKRRKPKAAKKAAGTTSRGKGKKPNKDAKRGRPSIYTPEIAERIIEGLCNGVPLTIVCRPDDMPGITTVWEWGKKDPTFSEAIARAREVGFDVIAMDALRIADNTGEEAQDTIETAFGSIPNKEWIMRSKLRVDTRFKLLSKWDPKRYGEKVTTELTGADGGPLKSQVTTEVSEEMEARIIAAVEHAAKVQQPASFRGEEREP